MFQFTPPHGGRRARRAFEALPDRVSIHAPTWGATAGRCSVYDLVLVSIHAPTWGATGVRSKSAHRQCFNSRPHMGGDSNGFNTILGYIRFNSRPHMGGDVGPLGVGNHRVSFNSRPHMGGDKQKQAQLGYKGFQFTPPHGGRSHYKAILIG